MAPDAIAHLEGGQTVRGLKAFGEFHATFLDGLPDIHLEIMDILADENDVCVRWEARGTHTGEILGLTATNAPVSFHGVTWLRVIDGRIVEGWDNWNFDGLLRQMSGPVAT